MIKPEWAPKSMRLRHQLDPRTIIWLHLNAPLTMTLTYLAILGVCFGIGWLVIRMSAG